MHATAVVVAVVVGLFAQLGLQRETMEVKLAEPKVTSAEHKVDKTIVKRYLRRELNKFRYCFEKQRAIDPTLPGAGTLSVQFRVLPDGTLTSVRIEGIHDEVENCVAGFVRRLQLPKLPEAAEVRTKVMFKPVKLRPLSPGLGGRCLGLGCGTLG